ncbi:MAG: ubiG [Gammaproteobacteria bacterium]|nr:MAG: ubiG [Gammaproteobacteria bacterium]TND07058.1 MAG: ubiG [Gammaproteobacteria bacterium]
MSSVTENVDPREVAKFEELAARWWDSAGECKPLHDINPLRLNFIAGYVDLSGARVVDVGCGGGILSEALAQRGAQVTGIDMAGASLSVASLHLAESGMAVDYRQSTAESFATGQPESFDVVTCMELLEHVPDPVSLVRACAALVRPGGHVFFSTINRNPKAYLLAVIGAEYLLNMLPKGTHDYRRFVRPSELGAWSRRAGLSLEALAGISYNPLTRLYSLNNNVDVNYLACFRKS